MRKGGPRSYPNWPSKPDDRSAAEPERVQSAEQVGFEPIAVCVPKLRDRPPPDLDEFALVRMQGLPDATERPWKTHAKGERSRSGPST